MHGELWRIYRALDLEMRRAGPGSLSRIRKAARVGKNYFRELGLRLEAGAERGFDLAVLLRALAALGRDRRDFFTDLYGPPDPIARLRTETARLGEPLLIVTRARQALAGENDCPREETLPFDGAGFPDARKLDDHRFKDPRQTLGLIAGALEMVAAGLSPRRGALPLLAVWGSARRMVFDQPGALEEAQQALVTAYELAEPSGDPALLGDLLQRIAYVVGDRGDRERALELTDRALVQHTTACHRRGVGRSLVDRGMWLYYLGNPRQAITAQKAALEHLPEDERRNRFSALQGLGLYYQSLGETEQARRYASLAGEAVDGLGAWFRGKLLWLWASINMADGAHQQAERYLQDVVTIFKQVNPIESAVATTELVRLQLEHGKPADAYEAARKAVELIGPLKGNRLAVGAIEELSRCGYAGRGLSIAMVEGVARSIQEGWERLCRRSHKSC